MIDGAASFGGAASFSGDISFSGLLFSRYLCCIITTSQQLQLLPKPSEPHNVDIFYKPFIYTLLYILPKPGEPPFTESPYMYDVCMSIYFTLPSAYQVIPEIILQKRKGSEALALWKRGQLKHNRFQTRNSKDNIKNAQDQLKSTTKCQNI